MKKKLAIFALICAVPMLTACGGKNELICSQSAYEGTIVDEYHFEFDGDDKLTGATFQEKVDFSKTEDFEQYGCENLEECMKEAKSEVEECKKDSAYTDCELINETKNSVTVKGRITDESLSKEGNRISKGMAKEDIKKVAEEQGLTCK